MSGPVERAHDRPGTALVGALLLIYAALCALVLSHSALVRLDTAVLRWAPAVHWPQLYPVLSVWVLLGQRAVCLVLAVAWLAGRALRTRDLRPLLMFGLVTLLLNASVGLVKDAIGRLGPLQLGPAALQAGASAIFTDGTIFPSGHTANAVVTWGVLAWLARRHRKVWALAAGVMGVSIGLTTIYLGTHWVSDVLAGWVAGGLVLLAVPSLVPVVERLDRIARGLLRRPRRARGVRRPGAVLPEPATMRS